MLTAPLSLYDDLCAMGHSRMPAYLRVDATQRLVEWGGSLSRYGITGLNHHQVIGEQIFFLEGLLPLDDPTLSLRWIETQPECYADLHLLKMNNAVWIWFLNATPEALRHRQVQQRVNEAALASNASTHRADSASRSS